MRLEGSEVGATGEARAGGYGTCASSPMMRPSARQSSERPSLSALKQDDRERRVRRTSCRPDSFHLHGTAVQCREERGRKIFRKKWSEL